MHIHGNHYASVYGICETETKSEVKERIGKNPK